MITNVRPDLIDRLMDVYVAWREECVAVGDAYARWSSAPERDRALAFASYRAAVDREESAAGLYRDHVDRVAASSHGSAANRVAGAGRQASEGRPRRHFAAKGGSR